MIFVCIENQNNIFDDKINYDYTNYDLYSYSDGFFTKPHRKTHYVINQITIDHINKYLIKF